MVFKRGIVIGLSLIVVLVSLAACAAPVSTPGSTTTAPPTLTSSPTATGALAQVIAGAKKEGTVTVNLKTTLTPKSMERLKKEINDKFGVDLNIKFVAVTDMSKVLSQALMEHQAGATPTYDLLLFLSQHIAQANAAGALEQVDWKPLITQDTRPEVVLPQPALRGAILNYTAFSGVIYNPEKISPTEVPENLSDLANPKWKGKMGLFSFPGFWARWAYYLGKDKLTAEIRAILKNKPIQGVYADLHNRYLIGEITVQAATSSAYLKTAWDKGMPAAFHSLDLAELQTFSLVVRKGAAHPNAAKLVAVYMATPAGVKFMLEEGGAGNCYYPGNFEYDIRTQNQKQGLPEYTLESYPGLLDFLVSPDYNQWSSELQVIFQSGG